MLIFLEASDAALVRRFSETRRPHPLAPDRSASEGIRDERARLTPIREMADEIVDTSDMTVHELRQFFMGLSRDRSRARGSSSRSRASASSTACRSTPTSCSTCAACRTRTSCRRCGGAPGATARWRDSWSGTRRRASSSSGSRTSSGYVVPHYVAEGKSYLTVAIGCTGGRHRSVMIAERLRRGAGRRRSGVARARAAPGHRRMGMSVPDGAASPERR